MIRWMGESVKMNLCEFKEINMCVFSVALEDKVNEFEDNFTKVSEWFDWYDKLKKVIVDKIWNLLKYPS